MLVSYVNPTHMCNSDKGSAWAVMLKTWYMINPSSISVPVVMNGQFVQLKISWLLPFGGCLFKQAFIFLPCLVRVAVKLKGMDWSGNGTHSFAENYENYTKELHWSFVLQTYSQHKQASLVEQKNLPLCKKRKLHWG